MSWHGGPESANKSSRSSRAGIEPARCLDSNTCEAQRSRHKNGRAGHGLHYILPHANTQPAPREHTRLSSWLRWRCRGAIQRGGPGDPPASFHSATTRICTHGPTPISRQRGAAMGELTPKLHFPIFAYLAASCAHFASVVRKEFAAGGGSTSPVNAALNVTMCP